MSQLFWPPSEVWPSPEHAPADAPLAVGGDLSYTRLLSAYSVGIFPWYNEPPILWWSPDPRMALAPADLRINRSLAKAIKKTPFRLSFDTAFPTVIRACGAPRPKQRGTWLNPEMISAYETLFLRGYAHSAECWLNGALVGGVYGVAVGGAFFGESMFSVMSDASKIAFVALANHLRRLGFAIIDCQVASDHMESLGARSLPRSVFLAQLKNAVNLPIPPGRWEYSADSTS